MFLSPSWAGSSGLGEVEQGEDGVSVPAQLVAPERAPEVEAAIQKVIAMQAAELDSARLAWLIHWIPENGPH